MGGGSKAVRKFAENKFIHFGERRLLLVKHINFICEQHRQMQELIGYKLQTTNWPSGHLDERNNHLHDIDLQNTFTTTYLSRGPF